MAPSGKLRREAGLIGLLFAGVGGMIGSGWLFGPLNAAVQAGPLAVWSWIIGGGAVLLLALVYAELATLFPKSGALVHMSHISHGSLVGFAWSWILILAYVTIAPIEAMAIVNYADAYIPGLVDEANGVLTLHGFVVAILVLGAMVALNFLMIRHILSLNSSATWWKLAVPLATVAVLLAYSWHPENLSVAPPADGVEGIFTAIATGGVFFSLFGFRQAIDLAGETADPGRTLPVAVIGTVVIGVVVYAALQVGFLLAIEPGMLAEGGWAGLHFQGITGPFAALAAIVGAGWWAAVLYADAIVSPGACGFIYMTTTSRVVMASAETGNAPVLLSWVNHNGVPWIALLFSFAVGMLFFFPFPSWQKMVGYISSITVLSYGIGPILLLRLRQSMPDAPRPFRLRGAGVIAPVAFVASNWIVLWSGADTVDFLFGLLAAILVLHALHHFGRARRRGAGPYAWRTAWWLVPWFGGLWILSATGPTELGGADWLSFAAVMAVSAVFSLAVMALALRVTRSDAEIRETAERLAGLTQ